MQRVLRTDGRVMFVEPWRTLFLTFVHFISELSPVRRISSKMDAFATMTHYERRTYEQWLASPNSSKKLPALTSCLCKSISLGANGISSALLDKIFQNE